MLRLLIICGIAGLHLLTVLVLFASSKALKGLAPAQGAGSLVASVMAGVLRTPLFPIVEIVILGRIELPTGGLVFVVIPLNRLLWGAGIFYIGSNFNLYFGPDSGGRSLIWAQRLTISLS